MTRFEVGQLVTVCTRNEQGVHRQLARIKQLYEDGMAHCSGDEFATQTPAKRDWAPQQFWYEPAVIRGLTLFEPYATAIKLGVKQWETRSFKPWKGVDLIAIHAGQKMDEETLEEIYTASHLSEVFGVKGGRHMTIAERAQELRAKMPKGVILCVVKLEEWVETDGNVPKGRAKSFERFFGNFSPGRFAWKLKPLLLLDPPIRCTGALGLWKLPPAVERVLLKEIKLT